MRFFKKPMLLIISVFILSSSITVAGILISRNVALFGIGGAPVAVDAYTQFVLWRDAVPSAGEFYCKELNSTLSFDAYTLEYKNQSCEVFMEHGGLFHVILPDGSHWYPYFFWNRETNVFVLIPRRTNGDFKIGNMYSFQLVTSN